MHILLVLAIAFYLLLALMLCVSWLVCLKQAESDLSHAQQRLSLVVIAIATVFWPLVVPFAYLAMLTNYRKSAGKTALSKSTILALQ